MCGRYTQIKKAEAIIEAFHLAAFPDLKPRYNIAPSQMVPCVRLKENSKTREGVMLKWGLIPSWAKDPTIGHKMINARAETVVSKPSFRSAFHKRRCLIVADGFYEWKKEGKGKIPFHFHGPHHDLFAFAGLWERWQSNGDNPIESCTIITTDANTFMSDYHSRMPVILNSDQYDEWLDLDRTWINVKDLLEPYKGDLEATPVSLAVNNPRNDTPMVLTASE